MPSSQYFRLPLCSLRFLGQAPREHSIIFKRPCTYKWSQLSDLEGSPMGLAEATVTGSSKWGKGELVSACTPCVLGSSQRARGRQCHGGMSILSRRGTVTLAPEGCLTSGQTEPFLFWTKRFRVSCLMSLVWQREQDFPLSNSSSSPACPDILTGALWRDLNLAFKQILN